MELPSGLIDTCLSEFEKNPPSPDSRRELRAISEITLKLSVLMSSQPPKNGREADDLLCRIGNLTDNLDLLVMAAKSYGHSDHPVVKAYAEYLSSLPPYLR